MRPKEILIDPINVDADGLAEVQTSTGGAAITLDGALIVDDSFEADYPRKIGVLSSGDDSGITFDFVGTDPDGKALTESLTGATGGTATTAAYFGTVDSITPSGAAAANVSAGTVDEFVTNTIPIETSNSDGATTSIELISGTIDISIEESYSRIQYDDILKWFDGPSALLTITADAAEDMSNHASAVRLKCNSYSSGAELRMIINQNRKF